MRIGTIIGIISLTPHVAESRIGIGGISMTAGAKSGLRIMVPLGTRNNMSQQYIAVRIGLNRDEVIIEADDDGLEMIAATLLRLRGRSGPSAHWHFSQAFGNASKGSLALVVSRIELEQDAV